MEKVKLDWNAMSPDSIITVWMKPSATTETINGLITNFEWCEAELERVKRKGKNCCLVVRDNGDIAIMRR
jgi:TusA-related sulfurtransferase